MSNYIDHSDPRVMALFDDELRSGPAVRSRIYSQYDFDYLVGILAASKRAPTPEQQLIDDLAARCTFDKHGRVALPANTPQEIIDDALHPGSTAERIQLLALLMRDDIALVPVPSVP